MPLWFATLHGSVRRFCEASLNDRTSVNLLCECRANARLPCFVRLHPLTPNRKVDRKKLPAPGASRPALARQFVAPRTPREDTLAGYFREALGLERVGVFDNFLELGGDSLSAVEIFVKIEQAFKVELALATFFKAPTVAGLAEELERAIGARAC